MKNLPSLKQLEYLVALDDTEHFGHAAERCHVTPSTLSAGIKDLEVTLGVELAERSKRTVMMTPVGREIAGRARLVIRDAEELMDLAVAQVEPLAGRLKLGVIPTIAPFLLPKALPKVRQAHPKLKLYLREEKTEKVLDLLRHGDIDAGLIALPYPTDEFITEPLLDDSFYFACHKDHPLATTKQVDLNDIHDTPLMLLTEGHCLRTHALAACQLSERKLGEEFEATSLQTLVQMVDAGLGVTLLPAMAVEGNLTKGTNIVTLPFCQDHSRQIGLVWRKTSVRAKEFSLLGEGLKV